LGIWQGCKVC